MSKRFLYLMAAFIAAAMTLAACAEADENENNENGSGSNVSGKRIKSWVQETSRPSDYVRVEYTYNRYPSSGLKSKYLSRVIYIRFYIA